MQLILSWHAGHLDGILEFSAGLFLRSVGAAGSLPGDVGPDATQLIRQLRQLLIAQGCLGLLGLRQFLLCLITLCREGNMEVVAVEVIPAACAVVLDDKVERL